MASLCALALVGFAWFADQAAALDFKKQRVLVNKGVIGVLGDGARGTDFELLTELATALDNGYERRVLPMAGAGSVRAIEDLLLLRGVDVALVQADVLDFYKKADLFPDIEDKVRYLVKLYNKEFHLLASQDFQSIEDLRGQKVNFGPPSSGSYLTASLVFDAVGIEVEPVADDYQIALDKLRQGEIAAWVRVDARPTRQVRALPSNDGLHLLPVPEAAIVGSYAAAALTSADYPNLIGNGNAVSTLSVPTVMAVYQWPKKHEKRGQLSDFFGDLIKGLEELRRPPYHPKWREVDPADQVVGWTRY